MTDIIQFLVTVNWPGAIIVAGAFIFAAALVWKVL